MEVVAEQKTGKLTEEQIKELKERKALQKEEKAEESKAKKEQKEQEQKQAQERKKKMAFNRQINYFIMRYMWQVIRGRSAEESIYLAFNMSRERYTRILETGKVGYGKNEVTFLWEKTGIPQEIFTGETRFTFPDKQGNDMITEQEWERLFEFREMRRIKRADMNAKDTRGALKDADRADYNQSQSDYKKAERAIEEKLQKAPRKGDSPFQRLCSFLKNGYGSRLEVLQEVKQALARIKVTLLDECSKSELQELYQALEQKKKMVNAVFVYRGLKGNFKKEGSKRK